jgi:hypothetical protein
MLLTPGTIELLLAREILVNDITARDEKTANLFLQCISISLFPTLLSSTSLSQIPLKETPRRRMTVSSSFNKISKDQLGNRVVVRGGATGFRIVI